MPFDVPPSSFGGGESAERDECRWHRCGAGWVPSPFHPMRMWWVSLHPSIITIAAAAAATGYTAREARHYTRQERKAEEGRAGSVVEGVRYRSTRRNGSTGYGTRRWYPTTLGQPRVRWYPTTTPACLVRVMTAPTRRKPILQHPLPPLPLPRKKTNLPPQHLQHPPPAVARHSPNQVLFRHYPIHCPQPQGRSENIPTSPYYQGLKYTICIFVATQI
mmetsp:Transcript_44069/g.52903  ORF Transcript_44069/g.52903 Transcript_44069/m.52903 type:complete len:218 (-) Transcript_44069:318-971(-)